MWWAANSDAVENRAARLAGENRSIVVKRVIAVKGGNKPLKLSGFGRVGGDRIRIPHF